MNRLTLAATVLRVLLVEDHADLRALLSCHLEQIGAVVDAVGSGEAALTALREAEYDAILIDLGLPDLDGLDVIRRLRDGLAPTVPILVLSARHSIGERVIGLDAGADDYLPKPFDLLELDARLRSIVRRTPRRQENVLGFAGLRLDRVSRQGTVDDRPFTLTRREAALLEELLKGGGHTLVKDMLEDRLSDAGEPVTANALEATVSRLRRRLANAGARVGIETIRGIGYRLVASPAEIDGRPARS